MSGTRSHSPKAQATDVLMVAHGWPSDAEAAEAALTEITANVQAHAPDFVVRSATMAAPHRLEAAMSRLAPGGKVYPFFMTDGWFVKTALRKRIGDTPALTPFGLEPGLPALAATGVRAALDKADLEETGSKLLLAAHGSARGKAAARATRIFADLLRIELPRTDIIIGFVEQEPLLETLATHLSPQTLCLPFFAMAGGHVREDVTLTLRNSGYSGLILPAIGTAPETPELIAQSLRHALSAGAAA